MANPIPQRFHDPVSHWGCCVCLALCSVYGWPWLKICPTLGMVATTQRARIHIVFHQQKIDAGEIPRGDYNRSFFLFFFFFAQIHNRFQTRLVLPPTSGHQRHFFWGIMCRQGYQDGHLRVSWMFIAFVLRMLDIPTMHTIKQSRHNPISAKCVSTPATCFRCNQKNPLAQGISWPQIQST